MKRKFVVISMILMHVSMLSFGQNQRQFGVQIDSIQKLINDNPNDDIDKIQQLNELARFYFYNQQPKEGFIATKKALKLSKKIGFESGKVMYYLTLSAYHGNAENDMHIYYRKKAEWLSKSFGSQSRNYFVNIEAPEVFLGNDHEKNREEYLKILAFFNEEDDKEIRVNLMLRINYLNFVLGEIEKVFEYFDRIDAIYDDLGQVYPKFLNASYKLMIYSSMGDEEAYKNTEAELLQLFVSSKDQNIIGLIASTIASGYADNGRFLLSIEYYLKSIKEFEETNDLEMLSVLYHDLAVAYENVEMNSKAVDSYEKSIDALISINNTSNLYVVYGTIIFPLIAIEKFEQAKVYMDLAAQDTLSVYSDFILARLDDANGQILMNEKKYQQAIPYFEMALNTFKKINPDHWGITFMYLSLAECNAQLGNYNEALSQVFLCLEYTDPTDSRLYRKANLLLSRIYENLGDELKALQYLKSYHKIVDESDKLDEINRIADAEIKTILEKSKKEIVALEREQHLVSQENRIQRLWLISVFGALLSALLVLYVLFRNNRNKQKTNVQLKQQKERVEFTLEKLKSAQTQLIHAEKMASLGELTAGIAHEIQNPLNFVNNFSEVNAEMLQELKVELEKGKREEVKAIVDDLIDNEQKINHHGKRADAIVKGMLQHSRTDSGQKEPTDLNALADEYLRLAYHGLRVKDKSFNAGFKTDFDPDLPKVNVVSQDMGRVMLNLINNAFHAVNTRYRDKTTAVETLYSASLPGGKIKPLVTLTTKNLGNKIEISVQDNGPGIPDEIKDKIFQPFFTTKPTGEGTGLGLSMSYDIITKGHGGTLEVTTTCSGGAGKVDAGTEFIIVLPINPEKVS